MAFERLSAQDATFLHLEEANAPMHVGAIAIFGPLSVRDPGGGIAIDAIRSLVASRLPRLPRYRMRLAYTPLTGHPVWVDDPFFDLRYHIRYVCLPPGSSAEAFEDLATSFLSQKLDRSRPLWEILVAEGLEGGRIGALFKAHHALIDGLSGVDMLILLLGLAPTTEVSEPPRWEPRELPGGRALLEGELRRRALLPLGLVATARSALAQPRAALAGLRSHAVGVGQLLRLALQSGAETPLNDATGPNRRLATFRVELTAVKRVRRALGGTINDVVLAITAGGLRRFFEMRGQPSSGDVRALIPLSTRTDVERGTLGNKLAVLSAALPVAEPDPRRRLEATRRAMDGLKSSKVALGNDVLNRAAEWTDARLLSETLKLAMRLRSAHLMVTNIRGPADPLYFLDAPLLEVYPAAPLWPGQTLTVGVMSYGDWLHWGFAADADRVPDVDQFVDAIRAEVHELSKAAREVEALAPPSEAPRPEGAVEELRTPGLRPVGGRRPRPRRKPAPGPSVPSPPPG